MVSDAWIRVAPPGAPLAGYFTIMNHSHSDVNLVDVAAQGFGRSMMHRSYEEGGLMKMAHVDSVEIAAHKAVAFAPGGFHLMLMKPDKQLVEGDHVAIKLTFDNGVVEEIMFVVQGLSYEGTVGEMSENMDHSAHGAMPMNSEQDTQEHGGKHHVHGDHPPTLSAHSHQQDSGQWMLMMETENFTFSEKNQDGDHVEGEGHAHLYIDGEKIGRVFNAHVMLPLLDAGEYDISVALFTNNHMAYWHHGKPVRISVKILVE